MSRPCSLTQRWTGSEAPSLHASRLLLSCQPRRHMKRSPCLRNQSPLRCPAGSRAALPQEFREEHGCPEPVDILDVGCSAGIGTRRLADAFPVARVTGLDPSPHFLAVAEFREREHAGCARCGTSAAQIVAYTVCAVPAARLSAWTHGGSGHRCRRQDDGRRTATKTDHVPPCAGRGHGTACSVHGSGHAAVRDPRGEPAGADSLAMGGSRTVVASAVMPQVRSELLKATSVVTRAVPSECHRGTGEGSAAAAATHRGGGDRRQRSKVEATSL